jgi:hypothetical protein
MKHNLVITMLLAACCFSLLLIYIYWCKTTVVIPVLGISKVPFPLHTHTNKATSPFIQKQKTQSVSKRTNNIPYMRRIMSGVPAEYTVIGFLKSMLSLNEVYPLYGRASRTNAHRWNYYTLTDRLTNIRLPIKTIDGRDCTVDMGCEELYDGTTVEILGKSGPFQVHVYKLDFLQ